MSKTSDEALARLEHKLDAALNFLMEIVARGQITGTKLPKMGEGSHKCPVCHVDVKYIIDLVDKSVSRLCECKTGKYAPIDLEQFTPPGAAGGKYGQERRGNAATEGDDSYRSEPPARPRSR